jgi:hypothetical protein
MRACVWKTAGVIAAAIGLAAGAASAQSELAGEEPAPRGAETNVPSSAPPPPAVAPAPRQTPPANVPGRWMVHLNVAVNVWTHLAPLHLSGAADFTPDNHLIVLQQLGIGYWIEPHVRLQLTLQFGETITGMQDGRAAMTLFGAIPWVAYTDGPFFAGAGFLIAPRANNRWDTDIGIFMAAGAVAPLGHGWGLGGAVQLPVMFYQRITFAVSPAVMLCYRF